MLDHNVMLSLVHNGCIMVYMEEHKGFPGIFLLHIVHSGPIHTCSHLCSWLSETPKHRSCYISHAIHGFMNHFCIKQCVDFCPSSMMAGPLIHNLNSLWDKGENNIKMIVSTEVVEKRVFQLFFTHPIAFRNRRFLE